MNGENTADPGLLVHISIHSQGPVFHRVDVTKITLRFVSKIGIGNSLGAI